MYFPIADDTILQMPTPESAIQLFLSVGLHPENCRIPIPSDVQKQTELLVAARTGGFIEPDGRWEHLIDWMEALDGADGHIKNEGGTLLFTYSTTDTTQPSTE